jgi:hypothetical protein
MRKQTIRALRYLSVAVGLAGALGMTGCTAIRVKLGMRVHLAKLPVTTMQASLPMNPAIAPGQSSPLVVTFSDASGKTWATEGKGNGKILWSDLVVTPSVVTVNKKGVLALAHDPRKSDGKTGHVEITVPSHPDLKAELDIPVRYNIPFTANFDGAGGSSGMNGTNGSDGTAGMQGSPGSCGDVNVPGGDGGSGGNGTDGGNGDDGGPGGDAPPLKVLIAMQPGTTPLLQAVVSAPGRKDQHFLIDPQGGSLTILADGGVGGSGGSGGRGGAGGRGGDGGSGCPSGSGGNDGTSGNNGMAGSDGPSGRAGTISVVYDPAVKPYLAAIKTSNKGARTPDYQESAVAPLW